MPQDPSIPRIYALILEASKGYGPYGHYGGGSVALSASGAVTMQMGNPSLPVSEGPAHVTNYCPTSIPPGPEVGPTWGSEKQAAEKAAWLPGPKQLLFFQEAILISLAALQPGLTQAGSRPI